MVEYDLSSDPGNRVVSLKLRCGRCRIPEFAPVDSDDHYTVLMSDYLANGGDRYTSFKSEVFDYKSLRKCYNEKRLKLVSDVESKKQCLFYTRNLTI